MTPLYREKEARRRHHASATTTTMATDQSTRAHHFPHRRDAGSGLGAVSDASTGTSKAARP